MDDAMDRDAQLREALGALPKWSVRVDPGGMWQAVSPTYDLDGVVVQGRSSAELVQRVRVLVGVESLAMGREGRRPPGGVLCGVDFTSVIGTEPVVASLPPEELRLVQIQVEEQRVDAVVGGPPRFSTGGVVKPPAQPRPEGRAFGYEGDACPECQAMTMVRNGSCLKCVSCGATSGCS